MSVIGTTSLGFINVS